MTSRRGFLSLLTGVALAPLTRPTLPSSQDFRLVTVTPALELGRFREDLDCAIAEVCSVQQRALGYPRAVLVVPDEHSPRSCPTLTRRDEAGLWSLTHDGWILLEPRGHA